MTIKMTFAKLLEGLIGHPVELARFGVTLDLLIEACGVELLEPDAEFRKLLRRQLGNGLGDVFYAHGRNIPSKAPVVECLGSPLIGPAHRVFR